MAVSVLPGNASAISCYHERYLLSRGGIHLLADQEVIKKGKVRFKSL